MNKSNVLFAVELPDGKILENLTEEEYNRVMEEFIETDSTFALGPSGPQDPSAIWDGKKWIIP